MCAYFRSNFFWTISGFWIKHLISVSISKGNSMNVLQITVIKILIFYGNRKCLSKTSKYSIKSLIILTSGGFVQNQILVLVMCLFWCACRTCTSTNKKLCTNSYNAWWMVNRGDHSVMYDKGCYDFKQVLLLRKWCFILIVLIHYKILCCTFFLSQEFCGK